ncbi:NAD-dependent epimerase/dehydratase family protein [Sphingopyxis sp. BSN-002]|uniref:NAD-dependent epimerase/dehydratase family protein n=1 Tax=Sphingopyxis sp. BSN-002 TaxID=2911495 RepID=UPI001EDAA5DE|nr:NAD-dependent epimerase/dehydratase family protein [Sphingopyxis sp. BSN-002]UKK85249.1 NAD-dependent epimerase/dehydratase family protein [Sphingopyxis sp. BSN-002]
MRIAVAGATGFLGGHLADHLAAKGVDMVPIGRTEDAAALEQQLAGCDALINCAGEKSGIGPAAEDANVALPERLFLAAAAAGVPAFVHVSSVAALTSATRAGETVSDDYEGRPTTSYGISKRRGDDRLSDLAPSHPAVRLAILRPPILIGADAGGPFAMLRAAARRGLPLPIGGTNNRRSIVHVDNFAAALLAAAEARLAGTYIVTDSPALSTDEFYARISRALGREPRLFPIGSAGRGLLRRLLGQRGDSLFGDAAFSGERFAKDCPLDWPVPAASLIERAVAP